MTVDPNVLFQLTAALMMIALIGVGLLLPLYETFFGEKAKMERTMRTISQAEFEAALIIMEEEAQAKTPVLYETQGIAMANPRPVKLKAPTPLGDE
ncbi:unnamed protein product [marine sediment metagenome]|uniref:Uncharacterized protein n=1 Tax=marine sediment metagenome TaxID=412755 RepID=X0XCR4_9ZZZZ